MYRLLKWLVWIAGVCFVLIVVAIFVVQVFLSSDEIIRIAEREGRKILGRKVSIERLELGLFKIEASGIVIDGQAEKGGEKSDKPFVRFDDVEILLNPSTLIYKRISILQLTIKSATARVHRDGQGRFNFQDIIDNLNRESNNAISTSFWKKFSFIKSAEAAESVPQSSEQGFSFTIHEFDLYDAKTELRFDASHASPAFDGSCSFAHIEVDNITPGKPLDVVLEGKCKRPDGQPVIEMKGNAYVDMTGPSFRASFEMPLLDSSFLPVVAPTVPGSRFRKGIFAGNLKFGYVAEKPVTWDIDLNGQNILADFQMDRRAKWRKLALPRFKLKTKGRFNLLDGSAHIDTLFVETPFLDAKLTKPSFWNVSAQDEVHFEANIRDMRETGDWISRVAGIALRGFQERATARVLVSVKRDRKISDDFVQLEVDSRFDPVDLSRFVEFIPSVDHVSKIKGKVGGKARVVFVSGERVGWDVALETRDFGAKVRIDKRKQWKALTLGRTVLHSAGNYDEKNASASINTLEIKLPFAMAKLKKPAQWNVDGNDEAAIYVEVSDFSSTNDFMQRLGLVSLGDVPQDAKLRFNVAVSRNRKNPSAYMIDTSARFDSLPVAPLVDFVPLPAYLQKATGWVSGELQVSSTLDGALRWKADIVGKNLGARTKIILKEKWRDLSLVSLAIQSDGFYLASEGSAEIKRLDLRFPFARAYLNRMVLWNQNGRDEFSFTLDITDLSTAEVWLGELIEHPVQSGPKNEKLKISLSGTRNRKDGAVFSYKGYAFFDPVHISPWVNFVSDIPVIRNLAGEIAGKIEFSYVPKEKAKWNLGLTSENLSGELLAPMSRDRRLLQTGKFSVETTGSYDFQNQSGRLQSLNLNMPFGDLRASGPADWSMNGVDSGRFQWTVSSLKHAARLAGSIFGEPVSEFLVAGAAKGTIEVSRSRKKPQSISTRGSFAVNLSSLGHVAYPNFNVTGSFSGQVDDDAVKIRIPKLKTSDSNKPNAEPDIILQDLKASLERSSIFRGEIRSPSVRIKKLNIRYVLHEKGKTNFDSLFEPTKAGEKQTRRLRNREKTLLADKKTTLGQRRKIGKKGGGPLFPAIKIAKFEVARIVFYYQDFVAADKPPVVLQVPDAKLLVTNLDTLMVPGLRETSLEFRTIGESPSILVKANLNPGSVPPDVDGIFNLSRFDLRKISPYIRDSKGENASALLMRGTEITRGMLDFKSTYSLRKSHLNLDGTAQITGLRLKPDEKFPLVDLVVKLLRESVFRLFERPDDTIKLNVRVTGRLDDPEFHFLDAIAEPIFVSLFEKALNLGGNVKDIVTGILGTAIEGVQKIVPVPRDDRTTPDKGSAKELDRGESQLEQFGKKLEKSLRKGLRGLFGAK